MAKKNDKLSNNILLKINISLLKRYYKALKHERIEYIIKNSN